MHPMGVAFDSTENVFIADCETTAFKHSLVPAEVWKWTVIINILIPLPYMMTLCMLLRVNPQGFSVLL